MNFFLKRENILHKIVFKNTHFFIEYGMYKFWKFYK